MKSDNRFSRFPTALARQSRISRAGDVPVLLAHPDWESSAPVVLWMHGRTVNKELDPGRYLRWIRAGIAACAVDLPGHGERYQSALQHPQHSLHVMSQMLNEINAVIEHLAAPQFEGVFDLDRVAIGGMSAGGMTALRRLCDPHPFRCAAVEATTGNLAALYDPSANRPIKAEHPPERVRPLDPIGHLGQWRPIPLLVVHSEADQIIPFPGMKSFIDALRDHYRRQGADPAMIEVLTWPRTGAMEEHMGFGRHSNEAKNAQTDFFRRNLGG